MLKALLAECSKANTQLVGAERQIDQDEAAVTLGLVTVAALRSLWKTGCDGR